MLSELYRATQHAPNLVHGEVRYQKQTYEVRLTPVGFHKASAWGQPHGGFPASCRAHTGPSFQPLAPPC